MWYFKGYQMCNCLALALFLLEAWLLEQFYSHLQTYYCS